MVWQQIIEGSAVRYLKGGALGVAEDHADRRPRNFTRELIQQGLVRRLFLECDSSDQPAINKAVKRPKDSPDYEAAIAKIVDESGPKPYDNKVTLGEVAIFALKNLVPVHFIDLEIKSKTHPGNVAKRDEHAAELFKRITARHGPVGCLLLFGGAHFVGGTDTYRGGGRCLGDLLDLSYVFMQPRFEIYQDARDKYRFRLRAETGEPIATSRSYATRAEALARIKAVKRAAAKAHVPE